jgi:hypothetical protein
MLTLCAALGLSAADSLQASTGVATTTKEKTATKTPAQKRPVNPPAVNPPAVPAELPKWLSDYSEAIGQAKRDQKMLLVHFCKPGDPNCQAIEQTLARPELRGNLQRYVLARVGTDSTISQQGRPIRLLDHPSFSDLRRGPGLAVIDLAHKQRSYYGAVVSAVPTTSGRYYRFRPEHVPAVLDLPPGTLTQRTMVFAVRTHHERPASTNGQADPDLVDEATSHSRHQAAIRVQGHHGWGSRFQRIIGRLTGRGRYQARPVEVVAESWPHQDLNDACADCVQSWRQSSGHWGSVKAHQASYGYDIRRGDNGIWYATGIFSN